MGFSWKIVKNPFACMVVLQSMRKSPQEYQIEATNLSHTFRKKKDLSPWIGEQPCMQMDFLRFSRNVDTHISLLNNITTLSINCQSTSGAIRGINGVVPGHQTETPPSSWLLEVHVSLWCASRSCRWVKTMWAVSWQCILSSCMLWLFLICFLKILYFLFPFHKRNKAF